MVRSNARPARRALVAALLGAALAVPAVATAQGAAGAQAVTFKDIKGRSITLAKPATRLLIDDGRYLIALALIHPDPVSVIAAWPRDINRIGDQTYASYLAKFPRIESIPQVASSAGTFSLERAIGARPDVAVFTLGQGPSDDEIRQLASAGITVVFIDFFTHPFQNVDPSLLMLGQITGRTAAAQAFVDFRRTRMDAIAKAIAAKPGLARPKVFLEAHAGISEDCCNSPGKGNIGDYVQFVGGHNIGADVLPGAYGRLNIEYVVSQQPAVYIATGGPHLEKPGGLVLGPSFTAERSRASLEKMSARTGIAQLNAVKQGNVHGLSHQLLNSPLDILAVEALAKWINPQLFGAINPAKTMAEINARFLAVPLAGTLWIDLR